MQVKKKQWLIVKRKANKIVGDTSRVITRPHIPEEGYRISKIIQRIMSLSESAAKNLIAQIIQEPEHPWEFIQIGNCGSPLD